MIKQSNVSVPSASVLAGIIITVNLWSSEEDLITAISLYFTHGVLCAVPCLHRGSCSPQCPRQGQERQECPSQQSPAWGAQCSTVGNGFIIKNGFVFSQHHLEEQRLLPKPSLSCQTPGQIPLFVLHLSVRCGTPTNPSSTCPG